ncbi:MAG: hypothetical protein K2P58_08915 [Hyphomonadaceae bacterium]|nr:hypothetical protein [Hyphomonadaceae bacterium]
MRWTALAASALSALALTGCFSSESPLYPESRGSCPFRQETTFGVAIADASGAVQRQPAFTMSADGGACVRVSADSDETQRVVLTLLQQHWYVAQEVRGNRYFYGLVRYDGETISSYQPQCSDFTPAALAEVGVENPWTQMFESMMQQPQAPPGDSKQVSAKPPTQTPSSPPNEAGEEGSGAGTCELTSRTQVETLFRNWIRLDRPAEMHAHRMPAAR